MNDPAIKAALSITILMAVMAVAFVFWPMLTISSPTTPDISKTLSLQSAQPILPTNQDQAAALSKQAAENSADEPTILKPQSQTQPAPVLPSRYPVSESSNSARWGMPRDMMPVMSHGVQGPVTHKIVDGDSLHDLAQRYLGSPDRAKEIYEANRNVLKDPDILPIDVELLIPARSKGKNTP